MSTLQISILVHSWWKNRDSIFVPVGWFDDITEAPLLFFSAPVSATPPLAPGHAGYRLYVLPRLPLYQSEHICCCFSLHTIESTIKQSKSTNSINTWKMVSSCHLLAHTSDGSAGLLKLYFHVIQLFLGRGADGNIHICYLISPRQIVNR